MVVEFSYPRILLSLVMCQGRDSSFGGGDTDTDQTPTRRRETAKTWPDPERARGGGSAFVAAQVSDDIVGKTKILTFP